MKSLDGITRPFERAPAPSPLGGRGKGIAALHALAFLLVAPLAHADVLIDPTRPANAPTKSSSAVRSIEAVARVTAIFKSGDRRVAVLDGRVVKAGDRIGDVVIQEVLADGVRYTRAGRVEIVRIPKQAAVVRSEKPSSARNDSIRQESSP